jgi:hypothetical protein
LHFEETNNKLDTEPIKIDPAIDLTVVESEKIQDHNASFYT